MFERGTCPGGDHRAPKTGGSCACGMVTRIPARRRPPAEPPAEVLSLLAQCLGDGSDGLDAAASGLLKERADRLLAALTTAGLLVTSPAQRRLSA